MKHLEGVRFRYGVAKSYISCSRCGGDLTDQRVPHDAVLHQIEEIGLALKLIYIFPGHFHIDGDNLVCPDCLKALNKERALSVAKPQEPTVSQRLEELEKKISIKMKESAKEPDDLSRWRQADEILKTLKMLAEDS